MAHLVSHFYLFAHDPRSPDAQLRRAAELHIPNDGIGVRFTNENHDAILAVINNTLPEAKYVVFPVLPKLLAPDNGGLYDTVLSNNTFTPLALFVWEKLNSAATLAYDGATHAVYFRIFTGVPSCATDLAGLLLRLTAEGFHNNERPVLKKLVYSILPSAVHGIAYFSDFDTAYNRAKAFATANPYYTFSPSETQIDLPVTTWPENTRIFADADVVLHSFETAVALTRV